MDPGWNVWKIKKNNEKSVTFHSVENEFYILRLSHYIVKVDIPI